MNDPRKHHYLARAYLAGFTSPMSRQLHVFDRRRGVNFYTKPENVGHERDFYRIEQSEAIDDEFFLERQLFQRIDDDGLVMFRRFACDPRAADRQTRKMAMMYMAAAYLRTPQTREKATRLANRLIKTGIEQMCKSDEEFQQFIKYLSNERRCDPKFDLEQFRKFGLNPDKYDISLDRNWTVGLPLQPLIPIAMQGLWPREWFVMKTQKEEHFVTCDSPLGLVPIGQVDGPIVRLDSPDTIALFPVDREHALVGLGVSAARLRIVPRGVRAINRAMVLKSHRFVFASEPDFVWEDESGNAIGNREFLALGAPGPDDAIETYPIPPLPIRKEKSNRF